MSVVSSAVWRRLDVPGTDTCSLLQTNEGWALAGLAEFAHDKGWACVSYRVDCDAAWSTRAADVHGTVGPHHFAYRFQKGRNWTINGEPGGHVDKLIDIDFGFTPATNFLLMKRLEFPIGETVAVSVAWFDLGENKLTNLPQRYTRRSESEFWYESPTVNYEGILVLAETGFVKSYPDLWVIDSVP